MFSTIKKFGKKLDNAIREVNSPHWSLTKLGILVFLYPTITFVFVYDAYKNGRMDWMNTAVYICGIVTPRLVSQILAARFGYHGRDGERLDNDNSIDARPRKFKEEDDDTDVRLRKFKEDNDDDINTKSRKFKEDDE